MHINLHKTFSTPHGGGGPGAGPVVLSRRWRLRARALHRVARRRRALVESTRRRRQAFGRMCAFHGQMGMFVRALAYMMSHGATACGRSPKTRCSTPTTSWRALRTLMTPPFGGPCMHEALFDDAS
jgi:glycine dehydrogenase subunit 2